MNGDSLHTIDLVPEIEHPPSTNERNPMITSTYSVTGMTCSHCVAAVTAEVSRLDGVTSVDVDVATGAVAVTSDKTVDHNALRAAVEEAGYVLSD